MEKLKYVSIRGRVAYLICLFERLLLYYKCGKEEWCLVLEKLWKYTNTQYLDDWMYELAEYMPDSILEDTLEGAEYISESEYEYLYTVYSKASHEILCFLKSIFECGTCELYSRLDDYSPSTLSIIEEARNLLKVNGIEVIDTKTFEKYSFDQYSDWGNCFEGKELSIYI